MPILKKIKTFASKPKNKAEGFESSYPDSGSEFTLKKKVTPEDVSLPSRFIYAVDVPEVKNLQSNFVYNFYTTNECIVDKDILSDDSLSGMNLSMNIINKDRSDFTETELSLNRSKLPRYVKLSFSPPLPEDITYATSEQSSVLSGEFSKIVKEENFSTNFFTTLDFDNNDLISKTNVLFNSTNSNYSGISEQAKKEDSILQQTLSQDDIKNNTIFVRGQGQIVGNSYLESLKKLSTTIQINNALLHDLVVSSAGNPLTFNSEKFKKYVPKSASQKDQVNDYRISDEDYETSIDYYKVIANADANTPATYKLLGYYIEKSELLLDGSIKKFSPIVIEKAGANSYIDFDVRYGTTYLYEIRSVVDITYPAVNNETYSLSLISSLVASRPVRTFVETTENIAPPPPVEVKAVWDYNEINPNTMQYDPVTDKPYPNTGKYGSLLITWSFPVNSQMDIKKFQLFRRKSINDPFELIKMFDFNDAIFRFPLMEEKINKNVIEYLKDPKNSYYDYDFYKNSEYIYAAAAIDAHGLSSNYSEQILIKFDEYSNKLKVEYLSGAGAPKQYPNLFLNKDLLLDSIKTSTKKTLHMYLDPDCYSVILNSATEIKMLKTDDEDKYIINFINVENQKDSTITVKITDKRSQQTIINTPPNPEENNSAAALIEKSKAEAKIAANKKPKV